VCMCCQPRKRLLLWIAIRGIKTAMSDAYERAVALHAQITDELKSARQRLETEKKRLAAELERRFEADTASIVARLRGIEDWIRQHHELEGTEVPKALRTHSPSPRKPRAPDPRPIAERAAIRSGAATGRRTGRGVNPSYKVLIPAVAEILANQGRPMKRGPLLRALSDRGLTLLGRDPTNVLGTIIFNHARDQLVNLPSYGYWLIERPYEPAGYDPKTWQRELKRAQARLRSGRK
jgi:hypothetical protein